MTRTQCPPPSCDNCNDAAFWDDMAADPQVAAACVADGWLSAEQVQNPPGREPCLGSKGPNSYDWTWLTAAQKAEYYRRTGGDQ